MIRRLLVLGLVAIGFGAAIVDYAMRTRSALGGLWARAVFGGGGIVIISGFVALLIAFVYWRERRPR